MKILGIDPGLRTTGFGIINKSGQKFEYVASGTIKTPDDSLPQRLKVIFLNISEVIHTYEPECSAIEKVFFNINPQSTLLLGQARGAAICALVSAKLLVSEYTALQVKQAITGQGKAQKRQVQDMIQRLLLLPELLNPDASDALAVAVCHAHNRETLIQMKSFFPKRTKGNIRVRDGRFIV